MPLSFGTSVIELKNNKMIAKNFMIGIVLQFSCYDLQNYSSGAVKQTI